MRAGLAKPAQRAINKPWIQLGYYGITDAEAVNYSGTKLLQNYICAFGELQKSLPAFGRLEVQRNRFLVAVDLKKSRAVRADSRLALPGCVSGRWLFDLYHLGAQVAQHHRAVRPGQ